jgi:hypothetical protein
MPIALQIWMPFKRAVFVSAGRCLDPSYDFLYAWQGILLAISVLIPFHGSEDLETGSAEAVPEIVNAFDAGVVLCGAAAPGDG